MAADIETTTNMECSIKKKGKGKITKLQYVGEQVKHRQKCRTFAGFCAIVVTLCMNTSAPTINTEVLASLRER
jgi:hypothetical protein